jgi:hypothetical protein
MKSLLVMVLVGYAVLVLFAVLTADRQIFLPPAPSYHPGDRPLTFIETDDGISVAVRHLEHPEAEYTIIFSHGNAEDLGHLEPFLRMMRDTGFNVPGPTTIVAMVRASAHARQVAEYCSMPRPCTVMPYPRCRYRLSGSSCTVDRWARVPPHISLLIIR